jgi:Putative auto-transporter adhesin, head GIN domain
MRRFALVASAALAFIPAAAQAWCWGGTHGDGNKVTQSRQVGAFTAVRVEGSIDAAVKVGGAQAVAVTIDQNLQPLVTTEVSDGTLVIKAKDASWQGKAVVEITVPALRALSIQGSSDVTIDGGQGDLSLAIHGSGDLRWNGEAAMLEASVSGSGDMKLSGTAEQAKISVAGSGEVKAGGLTAKGAAISVAGSGDVELTLDGGPLSVSIAGSGDVVWHGKAMLEQVSVRGSGELVKR